MKFICRWIGEVCNKQYNTNGIQAQNLIHLLKYHTLVRNFFRVNHSKRNWRLKAKTSYFANNSFKMLYYWNKIQLTFLPWQKSFRKFAKRIKIWKERSFLSINNFDFKSTNVTFCLIEMQSFIFQNLEYWGKNSEKFNQLSSVRKKFFRDWSFIQNRGSKCFRHRCS